MSEDLFISRIKFHRSKGALPTVSWARQNFGFQKNSDVYASLRYGRAVLANEDQLNQYLYSYAPMIESQWKEAFDEIESLRLPEKSCLIDYGCGQGLAGMLLASRLSGAFFALFDRIILIEPSRPALDRAEAVYRSLAPSSQIQRVNKRFDEIDPTDLNTESTMGTLHVFSNVLDIAGYDRLDLFGMALSPGLHAVLAVSHDRSDHDQNSRGIEQLATAVADPQMSNQISIISSQLKRFKCENRGEPAISWQCQMEVKGA